MATKSKSKSSKNSNHSESKNAKSAMKFQDLPVATYTVMCYSDPYKSNYGPSYKLTVKNKETEEIHDVWSTPLLAKYIKDEKPKKAFKFLVKVDETKQVNNKYPFIKGYEIKKMHKLESCSDSDSGSE